LELILRDSFLRATHVKNQEENCSQPQQTVWLYVETAREELTALIGWHLLGFESLLVDPAAPPSLVHHFHNLQQQSGWIFL
jgi:hypothetical protein